MLRLTFSRSGGFGLRFAVALVAGRLVMGCGARSTLESATRPHGAGGAKTSTSTAAMGSGGAASSTMMSSASASSSSSTGTGAPPMCASDDDCAGAGFCWFGACLTVHLLAAGGDQACAVTSAGGVQCWGDNSFGELGNDSNETSQIPIGIQGLASGVAGVAAGLDHECAWTNAGAVLCWGTNVAGQLGDGTLADSAIPVPVMGLPSPIVFVSAGAAHTCAVTTGGGVLCWGWNGHGQLGNGTTTDSSVPVAVTGLSSGVRDVAVGDAHTCATTTAGAVLCWGWNVNGQLGNGSLADSAIPVAVSGLSSGVTALAAGGLYNCAVVGGGAQCWGNDHDGELGDGTTTQSPVPVGVSGLSAGVASIGASGTDDVGHEHTCAVTTAGGVLCWGNNQYGQLGNGSQTSSIVPVPVFGLSSGIVEVSAGDDYTCALPAGGVVQCWGENTEGELGDGSVLSSLVPVSVLEP